METDLNIAPAPHSGRNVDFLSALSATRDAFDSVAGDYDGPRGNNTLIQDMREEMWRQLDATFAPPRRLIDLGCGTGLDAVRLAQQGHEITATDFSARMTARTRERAERYRLTDRIKTLTVGAHELARIEGNHQFDGAYSNLGALNCVPNLSQVAVQCARLLKPHGALVFAVIGRCCPWEIAHYALRAQPARVRVRFAPDMVPVNMNKHVVWTHYYSPLEFYRSFEPHFTLQHHRGLCVFAPPPYLTSVKEKHPRLYHWLWSVDRRLAAWPGLRSLGDHFLMILRRR